MRSSIRKTAIGALIATCLGAGCYFWVAQHVWPFEWGSDDPAFLGSTFGMSREEVGRALKRHKAQLLPYTEYRRVSGELAILTDPFKWDILFNSDERDRFSMYMPAIEMFGADAEGEFEFKAARLHYVAVHFRAYHGIDKFLERFTDQMRQHYTFANREDSRHVAGAYTLHFASPSATADLWVNASDAKKPIITLSISRPGDATKRKDEIRRREEAAFR